MKNFIVIIISVLLFSCASSNKVSVAKKQVNSTKTEQVADNSNLVCKKSRKTGSRMNTRNCITKEQREKERRESTDALRNATNTQGNVVPGASNN